MNETSILDFGIKRAELLLKLKKKKLPRLLPCTRREKHCRLK
jgi:hypothetical protein